MWLLEHLKLRMWLALNFYWIAQVCGRRREGNKTKEEVGRKGVSLRF